MQEAAENVNFFKILTLKAEEFDQDFTTEKHEAQFSLRHGYDRNDRVQPSSCKAAISAE